MDQWVGQWVGMQVWADGGCGWVSAWGCKSGLTEDVGGSVGGRKDVVDQNYTQYKAGLPHPPLGTVDIEALWNRREELKTGYLQGLH